MGQRIEKLAAIYAVALGITYLVFGVMELTLGLYNLFPLMTSRNLAGIVPADVFGGLATLVIGATYLSALFLWKSAHESWGYVLVGLFLSAVFGILYLLMVCADGLSSLLTFLEGGEWTWEWLTGGSAGTGLLRPEICLFFASLPLAYLTLRRIKEIYHIPKHHKSYG
jgi:hypothetical protein